MLIECIIIIHARSSVIPRVGVIGRRTRGERDALFRRSASKPAHRRSTVDVGSRVDVRVLGASVARLIFDTLLTSYNS